MKVFVAGATGAIGVPLVAELIRRGHRVIGMSRSQSSKQSLIDAGAEVADANAFDGFAMATALREFRPEVVINQLTSLPKGPTHYAEAFSTDRRLRVEGGDNLFPAAKAIGVRRHIQQSSGFLLKATDDLADESSGFALDVSAGIAATSQMYAEIESRLQLAGEMETVALRYGFFYGPNTWYARNGAAADHLRRRESAITGRAEGTWSFVHIQDAAIATVAALSFSARELQHR